MSDNDTSSKSINFLESASAPFSESAPATPTASNPPMRPVAEIREDVKQKKSWLARACGLALARWGSGWRHYHHRSHSNRQIEMWAADIERLEMELLRARALAVWLEHDVKMMRNWGVGVFGNDDDGYDADNEMEKNIEVVVVVEVVMQKNGGEVEIEDEEMEDVVVSVARRSRWDT